jgi:hypothetical protein
MQGRRWMGCGLVLIAALAAGCSSGGSQRPGSECRFDRSDCMYEGKYEAGERDWAEDEAARLNRESTRRLRRR